MTTARTAASDRRRVMPKDAVTFVALYRILLKLAQRILIETNQEAVKTGNTEEWPAQQSWNDMVGSSHSIFMRLARKEAGVDDAWYKEKLVLYGEYIEEIYEEAAKRG